MSGERNKISLNEAKGRAQKYCAYQERSQKQLRQKLYDLGLYKDEVEALISDMILEGFINEERFARSYVGGKFRMKKWGRQKILLGLKQHDISEYCCKKGLEEIDEQEYQQVLTVLLSKRFAKLDEDNMYIKRNKVASFAISKGFEADLVWELLKENFS